VESPTHRTARERAAGPAALGCPSIAEPTVGLVTALVKAAVVEVPRAGGDGVDEGGGTPANDEPVAISVLEPVVSAGAVGATGLPVWKEGSLTVGPTGAFAAAMVRS
jgi:hypothetical protein